MFETLTATEPRPSKDERDAENRLYFRQHLVHEMILSMIEHWERLPSTGDMGAIENVVDGACGIAFKKK